MFEYLEPYRYGSKWGLSVLMEVHANSYFHISYHGIYKGMGFALPLCELSPI